MAQRLGKHTLFLPSLPAIIGYAAVAGKKESEGPKRQRAPFTAMP